jgi:hypothetical protein
MEAEVALNAVGCEEHFSFTCEYKQETVQGLEHNRLLVTRATVDRSVSKIILFLSSRRKGDWSGEFF